MNIITSAIRAFAALIFVVATAVPAGQAVAADPDDAGASAARGAKDWGENCARCHNMRDPKDFRADQWKVIMSHMRLHAGLTGQEARDILKFLQQSSGPGPAASAQPVSTMLPVARPRAAGGDPIQAGGQVYAQTCIVCHGADGKGAIPGTSDFTRGDCPLAKSDDVLLQHAERGFQTPGSPMAMPPNGGNASMSGEDLKDAIAYMRRSFRH